MRPSDLAKQTTLIILNKEIDDIMKIVKFLEESGSLIKGVCETTENEAKEQKGGLAASLLGNILTSYSKIHGPGVIRADEETIRAGQDFLCSLIV